MRFVAPQNELRHRFEGAAAISAAAISAADIHAEVFAQPLSAMILLSQQDYSSVTIQEIAMSTFLSNPPTYFCLTSQ